MAAGMGGGVGRWAPSARKPFSSAVYVTCGEISIKDDYFRPTTRGGGVFQSGELGNSCHYRDGRPVRGGVGVRSDHGLRLGDGAAVFQISGLLGALAVARRESGIFTRFFFDVL